MNSLLERVETTEVTKTPWLHLHLHGIKFPAINWDGKRNRMFSRRFDLEDRTSPIQSALLAPELRALLEIKFGPLEVAREETRYFIDQEGYTLSPHTDIKSFTMLFYTTLAEICLCESPLRQLCGKAPWFEMTAIHRVSCQPGDAIMFKPGDFTWHAVRPAETVRKTIQHFYYRNEKK